VETDATNGRFFRSIDSSKVLKFGKFSYFWYIYANHHNLLNDKKENDTLENDAVIYQDRKIAL
jgi:hypothetical protein